MKKLENLLLRLENLHPKYIDLSLERIDKLLKKLGNPHLELPPCIHIAGTNGKGSILAFIKNILIKSNYKVHTYTSPHLEKINERFCLANKTISDIKLYKTLVYIEKINQNNPITFYEITTTAAFYLFNKTDADFLLLETGLGGTNDATNIINNSLISIITPIGLDHQEYLGHSIENILKEKLGIIKKRSVIISSKQKGIIKNKIIKYSINNNNKIISYGNDWLVKNYTKKYFNFKYKNKITKYRNPSLIGIHQIYNASTALAVIEYLKKINYNFKKKNVGEALFKTKWPGRLELIKKNNPTILLDGAHNIDGAKILKDFIKNSNKVTWLIVGMLNSKKPKEYLQILKKNIIGVVAVEIPNEKNTLKTKVIKKTCDKIGLFCKEEKNINNALNNLIRIHKPQQIIITGSLYLIGKIRKKIKLN